MVIEALPRVGHVMRTLYILSMLLFIPLLAFSGQFTPTDTPVGPSGQRAQVDLPGTLHQRNTAGTDGLGLCVFSAFEDLCEWMGETQMRGFHKWMEQRPGGGWPEKLDDMVREFCTEKGVSPPAYLQHIGGDEKLLELALKTRRGAAVTYAGMDDFYMTDIAHMVVLSEFGRNEWASIMDNNRPGEWVWMSRTDFTFRWKLNTVGQGWAVVLLGPPPPPSEDGMDPVPPKPKPAPRPAPKPRRPFLPWRQVTLSDGSVLWKLYDESGTFHGMWDSRGWHKAVTPDGWTPDAEGKPPIDPPTAVSAETISWRKDYFAATQESQKSKKPLLVLFTSDSCSACTKLELTTLRDPSVIAKINALFIPVLMKDAIPEVRKNFNVSAYPTGVVVDNNEIKDNFVGAIGAEQMLKFLQSNITLTTTYLRDSQFITKDEAHKLLDDSDKWFVTAVVGSEDEKAAFLKSLDAELKTAADKVHLNVYTSDFWAAKRVKHMLTVQKPFGVDNKAVWFSDTLSNKSFRSALVAAGVLKEDSKPAPAPEPKPEPKPEPSPSIDPVPVPTPSSPDPLTIPLWAFWGGIAGIGYVLFHLNK